MTNAQWQQGFLNRDGLNQPDRAAWAFLAAAEGADILQQPGEKRNAILAAKAIASRTLRVLKCDQVLGTRWSKDQSRVLLWTHAGDVKIWNIAKDELVAEWKHDEAHPVERNEGVRGATFSRDEKRVLSWGDDGTARLWDVAEQQPFQTWKHEDWVRGAAFDREERHVLTWSNDGTAKLWDTERDHAIRTWVHDNTWQDEINSFDILGSKAVEGAVFDQQGKRVLTWSRDRTARLYDVFNDEPLHIWKHEAVVEGAKFSPNETHVLTWSGDEARLWDVNNDKPIQVWKHDKSSNKNDRNRVIGGLFNSIGTHVLTWGDGGARLWEVTKSLAEKSWKRSSKYGDGFNGASFFGDESRVVTWSDTDLQLWVMNQDTALRSWKADRVIKNVVLFPDNSHVLSDCGYGVCDSTLECFQ